MNWFTITLLVFAVLAVGVLAYEVLRPRRSRKNHDAKLREADQGAAFMRGGSDLDNRIDGGGGSGTPF